ncbi:hypothetical protein B0H10DRAFT_2050643 [Mycena sp. CBHHK59/15]|nr:hypothetical protein B0H10DRAFT_2050643 [Mycena sp. CBHHK59/15]
MSPTLPVANLAVVAIESLLYGMYFVVFFASMYLLLRRHDISRAPSKYNPVFRSTVFISAGILFLVVTGHWIITVYRGFLGFIYFQPTRFFDDNSQLTETLSDVFMALSILIGDCLIVNS